MTSLPPRLVSNEPTWTPPAGGWSDPEECAATDAEIDRLVYELYGLTEQEIAIVEGER